MDRIKIGQIGICHEHASGKIEALRKLPEVFEIVGVVNDSATQTAKRISGDNLGPYEGLNFMSEEELFSIPGLQAVTVETPNGDLVPTALRCMERNLAMHMDKPGGEDLALFGKLLDGCKARKLPFQMGYMFRTNPAMLWCIKAVREGWLGEIFEVQADMSHDYGGEDYQSYIGSFPGGIMFNLGCHLIDYVVSLMGKPSRITPILKSVAGYDESIRNNCLSILEYPHATVTLRACSRKFQGLEKRLLKICGTKGTVDLSPLELFDGRPLLMQLTLAEGNSEYPAGSHTIDFGIRHNRYEDQLLELARIIRGEEENPYTYEHDYLVQNVVLAASGYTKWEG
ncbi:MAG: Gfo/Idh/MocA family oxidoreductase [Planctomycetes bacterium]|nr:Gfo/Idh/MocA family oxidoreductase [Planctomycetota bacterium]